jgi:AcrR family transcriptional regulator
MRQPNTPATRATQQRIVEGARKILARQGIRATTVQHVLESSGVSRRTFYQYFGSLENLLLHLYTEFTDQLANRMDAAIQAESDPVQRLNKAIASYLDIQESGGPLLIAMQAEAIRDDSLLAGQREQTLDRMVALVGRSIADTLQVHLDPLLVRNLLMGVEGSVIHMQRSGSFGPADRARVEHVTQSIWFHTLGAFPHLPKDPDLA